MTDHPETLRRCNMIEQLIPAIEHCIPINKEVDAILYKTYCVLSDRNTNFRCLSKLIFIALERFNAPDLTHNVPLPPSYD